MFDHPPNMTIEFRDDHVSDLPVPVDQHLPYQKFRISALRKRPVIALELFSNHFPLIRIRVFECRLDNSNGVVLEHEVFHSARNEVEQLCYKLFTFRKRYMGFPP